MDTIKTDEQTAQARRRPYFIWWDQDLTEQDLRDALAGDNLYRRITVMSYIVNDAEFDDVWKYLSIRPDECSDPVAARVLAKSTS